MRAPDLEGKHRLHVFALEENIGAEPGGQKVHPVERRFLGNLVHR